MQYKNYTDLGITSSVIPKQCDLMIEDSNGYIWIVDNSEPSKIYKSIDKCANFGNNSPDYDDGDPISTRSSDYLITSMWYDRTNGKIYFLEYSNDGGGDLNVSYIDLSDDSINAVGGLVGTHISDGTHPDIFIRNGELEVLFYESGVGSARINRWNDPDWDVIATEGPSFFSKVIVKDADEVYFWGDTAGELTFYVYTGAAITVKDNISGYSYPDVSQFGLSYDATNNIVYGIGKKDADGKDYLIAFDITANDVTEVCELDIIMMLDRNTASGVQEKGIHSSNYEVYELHETNAFQWHLIATPDSDKAFIAVTDSFLMNSDGDMWEWEDVSQNIRVCSITRGDMTVPTGALSIYNDFNILAGTLIKIKDTFTTATSTATATIFEGYITTFTKETDAIHSLLSPANEIYNIKPSGSYSGRSDEIIVDLIEAYCNYITEGTLSNGGAMGTITFYGDKTMFEILNQFAIFDNFTWYLTPTGALNYNDGTTDSGKDLDDDSPVRHVENVAGKRAINYVVITGAIVSGSQVTSTVYSTATSIALYGKNPYERTHSHLNTTALCNTAASNALSRYGTQPDIVEYEHFDPTVGLIQEGETVTFEFDGIKVNISSAQFGIRNVTYDALVGRGEYRVSDRIL